MHAGWIGFAAKIARHKKLRDKEAKKHKIRSKKK